MAAGKTKMRTHPLHMSTCPQCGERVIVISQPNDVRVLVDDRDVADDLFNDHGDTVRLFREALAPMPLRVVHRCCV